MIATDHELGEPELASARDIRRAIAALHPRLDRLVRCADTVRVAQHAAALWRDPPAVRGELADRARDHLAAALSAHTARHARFLSPAQVRAALDRHPILQTADHAQLLLDPISFYTNVVFRIGAIAAGARQLFVNACSTLTLETRRGHGPGWLNIGAARINVFGLSRGQLTGASVCAAPGPVEIRLERRPDARFDGAAARTLARVRELAAGRRFATVADAFATVNPRLWHALDRRAQTELVYTDDRLTADLVARHLRDPDGVLGRLLFDPAWRGALDRQLAVVRSGVGRLSLRATTSYFWGVRDRRTRGLRLIGDQLIEPGGGGAVPFDRAAICDGLEAGRLFPDLCVGFLALSVLPRIRVLGGWNQAIYLPLIDRAFTAVAERAGGLAEYLEPQTLDGIVAGVIASAPDPLVELDELARGEELDRVTAAWSDVPLSQSMALACFDTLRVWNDELARSV